MENLNEIETEPLSEMPDEELYQRVGELKVRGIEVKNSLKVSD